MTPAQLTALKANILADQTLAAYAAQGAHGAIAAAFNVVDAAYYVWKTSVPVAEVFDAIIWANLTPLDAPDGTVLWTNRALACQGKQFNIQILLTGQLSVSGAKPNIRANLSDALTNVPSGANGEPQNAGWAGVKTALTRTAKRGEKLFATGVGSMASPATLGFEGSVSITDVEDALAG